METGDTWKLTPNFALLYFLETVMVACAPLSRCASTPLLSSYLSCGDEATRNFVSGIELCTMRGPM